MNIIITGGGKSKSSPIINAYIINCIRGGKMLFIPHAMEPKYRSHAGCLRELHTYFEPFGYTTIDLFDGSQKFDDYAAIYIWGGNTFLLKEILSTNNWDLQLKQAILKNTLIIGSSAGAIILGKDISHAHDEKITKNTDYSGLNVLNNRVVFCHFTPEKYQEEIIKYIDNTKNKVIALREECALHWTNIVRVIGSQGVTLYPEKTEYLPGNNLPILGTHR